MSAGKYTFISNLVTKDIDTVFDASDNPSGTQVSNIRINGNDIYKSYAAIGTFSFIKFGATNIKSNGTDIGGLFEYNLIDSANTNATYTQKPFYNFSGNLSTGAEGTALIVYGNGNITFNKPISRCHIYMIAGGGGGGAGNANDNAGGGGGGGGYYEMLDLSSTITKIGCTIGPGGAGGVGAVIAPNGGNTIVRLYNGGSELGNATVYGGGGGGCGKGDGAQGGNGGGGGSYSNDPSPGGASLPGVVNPSSIFSTAMPAGSTGGYGQNQNSDNGAGGGGGGCAAIGGTGAPGNWNGGNGGDGRSRGINTNSSGTTYTVYFGGGGGGGAGNGSNIYGGTAGTGGGNGGNPGQGGNAALTTIDSTAFYAGGGGGGGSNTNGNGGAGARGAVLIILGNTMVTR